VRTALPECVADGNAVTGGVVRAVIGVVVYEVNARLRADEETALRIKLYPASEVCIEMVTRRNLLGAAARGGSSKGALVVMSVLRADAADNFRINVAGEFRRVNGVEVVKDRPVIHPGAVDRLRVRALAPFPEHLSTKAKVVPEEKIPAKPWVGASGEGRRIVVAARLAGTRRVSCAHAECYVNLLGLGGT